LEIVSDIIPSSNEWRERTAIIDKMPHHTLNEYKALYDIDKTSLGIVKPSIINDVKITKSEIEWSEKQKSILDQVSMFETSGKKLRKLPYKFQYDFECDDSNKPHLAMITDWELGVLFLKEVERLGSDKAAAQSVKKVYLEKVANTKRDTRFFMGTVHPHNTWIIVGVFWPPKILQLQLL
jgi:hypothetical protein